MARDPIEKSLVVRKKCKDEIEMVWWGRWAIKPVQEEGKENDRESFSRIVLKMLVKWWT